MSSSPLLTSPDTYQSERCRLEAIRARQDSLQQIIEEFDDALYWIEETYRRMVELLVERKDDLISEVKSKQESVGRLISAAIEATAVCSFEHFVAANDLQRFIVSGSAETPSKFSHSFQQVFGVTQFDMSLTLDLPALRQFSVRIERVMFPERVEMLAEEIHRRDREMERLKTTNIRLERRVADCELEVKLAEEQLKDKVRKLENDYREKRLMLRIEEKELSRKVTNIEIDYEEKASEMRAERVKMRKAIEGLKRDEEERSERKNEKSKLKREKLASQDSQDEKNSSLEGKISGNGSNSRRKSQISVTNEKNLIRCLEE